MRTDAHAAFDEAVAKFAGSPSELRGVIVATVALEGNGEPMPTNVAAQVKALFGAMHRTYGAGCDAILRAQFTHSGGYWRAFLGR